MASTPNTPLTHSPAILRPRGRSLGDFEPLRPAEQKLLEACRQGGIANVSDGLPHEASPDNTVRADLLRFFALGGDERAPVHERGVQLSGAFIAEDLDLSRAVLPHHLALTNCRLVRPIALVGSELNQGLQLSGSEVAGINGDGAVVKDDVFLNQGFKATGTVRLVGAQIGGDLACRGGQFEPAQGEALSADRAVVKGSVFLTEGFKATGEVRLLGVQIGGDLACRGGQFEPAQGEALSADRAVVKGDMFLDEGFKATGEVRLVGAQIGGGLYCRGGQFEPAQGEALSADRVLVKGSVFLNQGFKATGTVRLVGAQIGSNLSCSGGQFEPAQGEALIADRAVVKGSVFLEEGFKATGEVRLLGAQIGSNLACRGGQFEPTQGNALSADGAIVKGGFFFRNLAKPVKVVSLASVVVGRLIDDENAWGSGLVLDGFTYAHLAGGAPCSARARLAWLEKQIPAHRGAQDQGADFRPQPWRQLQTVLRDMGHIEDARQVAIAFENRLRQIGRIGVTPTGWNPVRAGIFRTTANGAHWAFWALAGYGYRPMRLLMWFVVVWLSCAAFYSALALPPQGVFAPSDPLVFQHADYAACVPSSDAAQTELAKTKNAAPPTVKGAGNWYLCEKLREEYSTFSPLAYSLDVLLPLVDLGQEKAWGPLIPTPREAWYAELFAVSWKHVARWLIWFETLFGWVGSLLFVAIVSGLAKRRDE